MRLENTLVIFKPISRAKYVTAWLLASLLLAMAPAFTHAEKVKAQPEPLCMKLLMKANSSMDFDPKVQAEGILHTMFIAQGPTVELAKSRPGAHGGQLLLYKKTGEQWVSDFRTVDYDPQGDPRAFIDLVGVKGASFFGFSRERSNYVAIPDAAEFKGALTKLNRRLVEKGHEPVGISYYTTADNENVKVALYVQKYRDEKGIPLAQSGNHLLHDISFHTGAIFIPDELLEMKRLTVTYIEKFIAHLEKKFAGNGEQAKAARYYAYLWRMRETIRIDNATGSLTPVLLLAKANPKFPRINEYLEILTVNLTNDGYAPKELLAKYIAELRSDWSFVNSPFVENDDGTGSYNFVNSSEKPGLARAAISPDALLAELEVFAAQNPLPSGTAARFERSKEPEVRDKYCREMSERRVLIHKIASELAEESPRPPPRWWLPF